MLVYKFHDKATIFFILKKRNTNFEEIYRGLAIASAHLHLTNLDIIASSRCYPFETRANRQNMRM